MKWCPVCGKDVPRKCLKFCGKECYAESRRKRALVGCVRCKTYYAVRPFEAKRSKEHYCKNCRQQWENREPAKKEPTGYNLDCYFCGAPCYRQRWYSRRYVYTFCSKECRRAGWRSLRL